MMLADNAMQHIYIYIWVDVIRDDTCQPIGSFNRIASFSSEVSCLAVVGDALGKLFLSPLTGSKSSQVFETKSRGGWRGFDIDALGEKSFVLKEKWNDSESS